MQDPLQFGPIQLKVEDIKLLLADEVIKGKVYEKIIDSLQTKIKELENK